MNYYLLSLALGKGLYLIVPALLGKDSKDDVLSLGLSSAQRQSKFADVLDKLKDMKLTFYCIAVENEEVAGTDKRADDISELVLKTR